MSNQNPANRRRFMSLHPFNSPSPAMIIFFVVILLLLQFSIVCSSRFYLQSSSTPLSPSSSSSSSSSSLSPSSSSLSLPAQSSSSSSSSSLSLPASSSSSSSPSSYLPPSNIPPSLDKNFFSETSANDEWMRVKRSIGEKQTGPSFKSLCEDHCQCAQQNSSFPLRRRQQKAQHDSLALTSRSLVLTELQSSVQCKSGVSKVMDGCGCCLVCARQQGDSCDKIHPCDALKQLFCDTIVSSQNGLIIESGMCKPKSGEPCVIDGKKYEDGKQFQLNCSLSCSCQNGQYACASLCPQEERPPSSEHCGQAKLLSIAGRCCKEWVCPHPPQHIDLGLYSGHFLSEHTSEEDANRRERCIKDVSQWSSCSATCGTGWSIHMTNDNENCKTVVERKMCYMRPCPPDEAQINLNASQLWNECQDTPLLVTLNIEGCVSEKEVNTTICTICHPTAPKLNPNRHQHHQQSAVKKKCCKPAQTRTVDVVMKCRNGTTTGMKFKQIRSCKCKENFCRQ